MLWADPGTNLGFPLSLCLRARHLEVICSTKALGAGEGVALGREPPAWVSECWDTLWAACSIWEGCRQGRVVTALAWHGRLWAIRSFAAVIPSVTWWPLLGRAVSSGPPLHLPAAPPAFPGKRNLKAERPMQRSPQHFAKCFPSPPAPIYLGQSPRKAESRELALKCCLKCLLCMFIHLTTHIYVYIWNHLY